ncbi:MAG: TetR family transcriptional regulator C-terminal domain-containing protein [Parasporobacterium sp.]|nr:TetR family transcriptional regulator C-terminal domain-containing protein [Parasporobacterium sp.]
MNEIINEDAKKKVKENQRTRLTRMLFRKSLISLLKEKSLYEITASELCAAAELNRSTFYKHYDNVADVMSELENEIRDKVKDCMYEIKTENPDSLLQPLYNLLCYLKENRDITCLILKHSYDRNFLNSIIRDVMIFVTDISDDWVNRNPVFSDYIIKYIIAGSMNIIENWLNGPMRESPMEISLMISDISIAIMGMKRRNISTANRK